MKMMERKAYTAFGELGFGEMGFSETGRHLMHIHTRRLAVYLETHCNIGSKTAFPTGVLDR